MKNYQATIIVPVVTTVCLAVTSITGHPISNDLQEGIEQIAGIVIGAGLSIWGIFKNHKTEKSSQTTNQNGGN